MAAGGELVIDEKLVRAVDKLDASLQKLTTTTDKMASNMVTSFSSVNTAIGNLVSKAQEIQNVMTRMAVGSKNLSSITTVADDVNRTIQAISGIGRDGGLANFDATLSKIMSKIHMLSQEMALFKQWESGKLLNTSDYEHIGKVADELNRLMNIYAQLDTARKQLSGGKDIFKDHIDDLNGTSLAAQRAKTDLDRLNEAYRSGTSELQKRAKAEDEAAKTSKKKQDKEYARNLREYNQAMKANEATVAQRTNKLVKLRLVEEQLSKDSAKYANELARVREAMQRLTQENERQAQAATRVRKSHKSLIDTSGQLVRKLALLFSVSQIQNYLSKLVSVRKEFELQQKALAVLVRDQHASNKLWNQTVQLAVKSPFRVKELITYTKQLAAYRIENDKLHDTIKQLADVSSGIGVDMNRLILAYGQVRAAEYLRGTELRQFNEAGIPMLEELASHFTKLEGRAISTADVFERISKRMVRFEDVAEVFKRITSEGGIFYQMQEKQSETLYGQISNLHDSIDLMLNDIGAAQEGLLKSMIASTRAVVENWRAIASVMELVGATLSIKVASLFARGFMAATAHATLATQSLHGVALAGAKVNVMFQTLTKTIVAHPWIALAGAMVVGVKALLDYNRAIEANNKKYDELSNAENARITRLREIKKEIEANNQAIKENADSTKKNADAQKKNNVLLEELKNKFPEIYKGLVKQSNGIIEVSKAIEQQNKLLYINIALQNQAKGGAFYQDLQTNYTQYLQSQSALEKKLSIIRTKAATAFNKVDEQLQGETNQWTQTYLKNITELLDKINQAKSVEELSPLSQELGKVMNQLGPQTKWTKQLRQSLQEVNRAIYNTQQNVQDYNKSQGDYLENIQRQIETWKVGINKAMTGGGVEAAKQWIDEQLAKLGVVDEKILDITRKYIATQVKIPLTWEVKPPKEVSEKDLKGWKKTLWKAIQSVEKSNPDIQLGITLEKIAKADTEAAKKTIFESLETPVKEAQQNIKNALAGINEDQVRYTEEQIQQMEASVKTLKHLQNVMALHIKEPQGQGKNWYYELGKSIRDTHKDFITLHKDLDKTQALNLALDKNAEVFAEAAKNAGIDLDLRDFSAQFKTATSTIELLDALLARIPKTNNKAIISIEKLKGELTGEDTVRETEDAMKRISDAIDNAFDTYEISIELDKMGVSPDLANELFGIESIDLSALRQKILDEFSLSKVNISMDTESIMEYVRQTDMAAESIEALGKALQKLDDKESKELLERQKKYLNFLVDQQGKRVKILVQEMRDIEDIQKTFTINDKQARDIGLNKQQVASINKMLEANEQVNRAKLKGLGLTNQQITATLNLTNLYEKQKQLALSGVEHTTQESLDKQTWEDFKKSGYYEEMFEDLTNVSSKALGVLETRLKEMRSTLSHLSPEAYKEVQSAIDKIEAIQLERNPFRELIDSIKEVRELNRTGVQITDFSAGVGEGVDYTVRGRKDIEDKLELQRQYQEKLQDEITIGTSLLTLNEEQRQKALDKLKTEEVGIQFQGLSLEQITNIVNQKKKEKKETDNNVKNLQKAKQTYATLSDATAGVLKKTASYAEAISKALGGLDQLLESLGIAEDSTARAFVQGGQAVADMIVQVITLTLNMELAGIAANSMLGILGYIAIALQTIASLFSIFSDLHDAKLEKEIEKQAAAVEKLEKAYERLKKQMDAVYNIADIQHITAERQKNSEEQIASYERMIELEEQKKDSDADQIKEWRDEIEAEKEAMLEAEREREKAVGGFGNQEDYKEASTAFVEAWMDAYKETGNGLKGLTEKFDEFFADMVQKQLLNKGVESIMALFYKEWDEKLSDGDISDQEATELKALKEEYMNKLDKFLTVSAEQLGFDTENIGDLSTLQKGIQGITEDQADILASYLNSIRFFVAEQTEYLKAMADSYNNIDAPNPMLTELRIVADNTTAMRSLFESLLSPHNQGGMGLKVIC